MPNWGELGMQAASAATGGALGLIFGGINDNRQLRQQERLQQLQIAGNKEMMDYSMMKQLQMWNDTNYSAQMAQIHKAGLSPGLIYGMKGGGGISTGSPSGAVTGGNAPSGGGEMIAAAGMGMQLQLLKAQKDNIEADTANKQADAANKGADTELKQVQINTAEVQNEIAGKTQNMQIAIVQEQLRKLHEEATIAINQQKVSTETVQTQIEKAKADLAQTVAITELNRAQEQAVKTTNEKTIQEIAKIKTEIQNIHDYYELDNYIEREKVRLMDKGINVALISSTIGTILNFASRGATKK